MKLVCDACGTKYSIDDDRVSGKTFKIRCRKCSNVILLRGGSSPRIEGLPDPGAWHAVVDGCQIGPMAVEELRRRRAAGELDDSSLVWREGLADWCELGTVGELSEEVTAVDGARDGGGGAATIELAADLAAAAAAAASPAVGGAAAGAVAAAAAAGAAGAAAVAPVLRNERHETSVLFTLNNLARLASPVTATAAATATAGASKQRPVEGSGLIDIRSLAAAMAPPAGPDRGQRGSFDDLPVFASSTFVEPTLLVRAPRGAERWLRWALGASIGLLAIVATILLVIILREPATATAGPRTATAGPRTATAEPRAAEPRAAEPRAAEPRAAEPRAAEPRAAEPRAAEPRAAEPPAAEPRAAEPRAAEPRTATATATAPGARSGQVAPRRGTPRTATATTTAAEPTGAPVSVPPALEPKPGAEACSEVTCIVNNFADKCCEIYREAAPPPRTPPLPDSLDRPMLAAGIAQIDIAPCRGRSSARGDVTVSIKVSSAGAVTAVTVKSSPDPELSACVIAAANKAMFAKTRRGGSFAYVWRF